MKEIPVDARVECTDGTCGKSIALIVDCETGRLTHFAVEDGSVPLIPYQRPAPVEHVVETAPDLIRLKCSRNQLSQMAPFIHTRYVVHEAKDHSLYEGGGGAGGPGECTASKAGVVTKIEEDQITVYLKLDKKAVGKPPVIHR